MSALLVELGEDEVGVMIGGKLRFGLLPSSPD